MSELLADKTVLVTGAANGIGAASAERFAAHGARVVLVDVDADHGEANAEAIRTAGGDATFVRGDVSSAADVKAFLAAAVDRYGRIDAALNNAGIEETGTPFHESSEDGWDALHAVNLKGVFLCMKYEIRQMLAQGGGTIVNMASVAGLIGLPLGIGTYAATKHGVVGLTRTAAIEYARQGIRVNAVCPGVVRTAMLDNAINAGMFTPEEAAALHPTGALLSPRDVAETAAWLCSDVSGGMTGQAVAVDAGMTAG